MLTLIDNLWVFVRDVSNPLGHLPLVTSGSLSKPDIGLGRVNEDKAVVGVQRGCLKRDLGSLGGQLTPAMDMHEVCGSLTDVTPT